MTYREFFVEKIKEETPIFERMLKALPQDKLAHTHHPKSKTAEQLAIQMTGETESFMEFLSTGKTDWSKQGEYSNDVNVLAKEFVKNFGEVAEKVNALTDAEWEGEAVAHYEGKEVWKTTKGEMAWGLLLDLIHHRGQLSTYIRPMGGKVPNIYGPSGDATA